MLLLRRRAKRRNLASLSLSLKLTALLSPRRTKEEEEEEEKRCLFSLSLSLSLSKRTSEKLFLRARLFRLHEEKDFVLLFSSSLSSTVCVWRDNSTPKPHKKCVFFAPLSASLLCVFPSFEKSQSLSLFLYTSLLSLLRCKTSRCVRVLKVKCEEKREKKTFEKPKNTPKEETLIRESKKAYHAGAIDDHNTPLSSSSFLSLLFSLFESLSLCVRARERTVLVVSSCF